MYIHLHHVYICILHQLFICIYNVIIHLRSDCELEEASIDNGELSVTGLVLNEHPHRPHLKLPLNFTSQHLTQALTGKVDSAQQK